MKPVCKVYAHLKVELLSLSVVCGQDLITRAARRAFLRGIREKVFRGSGSVPDPLKISQPLQASFFPVAKKRSCWIADHESLHANYAIWWSAIIGFVLIRKHKNKQKNKQKCLRKTPWQSIDHVNQSCVTSSVDSLVLKVKKDSCSRVIWAKNTNK